MVGACIFDKLQTTFWKGLGYSATLFSVKCDCYKLEVLSVQHRSYSFLWVLSNQVHGYLMVLFELVSKLGVYISSKYFMTTDVNVLSTHAFFRSISSLSVHRVSSQQTR